MLPLLCARLRCHASREHAELGPFGSGRHRGVVEARPDELGASDRSDESTRGGPACIPADAADEMDRSRHVSGGPADPTDCPRRVSEHLPVAGCVEREIAHWPRTSYRRATGAQGKRGQYRDANGSGVTAARGYPFPAFLLILSDSRSSLSLRTEMLPTLVASMSRPKPSKRSPPLRKRMARSERLKSLFRREKDGTYHATTSMCRR
jgi:hypothetical protein